MPREKAQAAPTARPKVPMRRLGAHCLVVVMKRGNARGAKGVGHQRWIGSTGNGRNPIINGRRQPSLGGTSRMMREYHVRICEGLGVKFPGSTRQGLPSRPRWQHDRCTPESRRLAATPRSAESGHKLPWIQPAGRAQRRRFDSSRHGKCSKDGSLVYEQQFASQVPLALRLLLLHQDDVDADGAQPFLPIGDDIGHRRIGWVDRLNDGEPSGMGPVALPPHSWRRSGTRKRRR